MTLRHRGIIASVPAEVSIKSVVVDIADNLGGSYNVGIRSIDFYQSGSKITLGFDDFTAYETTKSSDLTSAAYVFDTSLSKVGSTTGKGWFSNVFNTTNQRLIVVFNTELVFDEIRINNFHNSGNDTNRGAKNVKIHTSPDIITNTTYNAAISNSVKIFDGIFRQHVSSDVEDEETLTLL